MTVFLTIGSKKNHEDKIFWKNMKPHENFACRLQYKSSSSMFAFHYFFSACKTIYTCKLWYMVVFDDGNYDPNVAICNEP